MHRTRLARALGRPWIGRLWLGRLWVGLRLAGRALLDLALPEHCAGCGRRGLAVCAGCAAPLLRAPRASWPDPAPPGLPPPWAVAGYEGPTRALVAAHKEHGVRAVGTVLGAALAVSVAAALVGGGGPSPPSVVLVPMPSRRAAVRARGRDPTRELAREAARVLRRAGVPTGVLPVLGLRGGVRDQAGLGADARAANLAGAVRLRRRRVAALDRAVTRGGVVLVVDDVVTTGASLSAAAGALRAHGLDVPAVAVVAATPRRARPGRPPGRRPGRPPASRPSSSVPAGRVTW